MKNDKIITALLAVGSLGGLAMVKLYDNLYKRYQLKCADARCWEAAAKVSQMCNEILQDELNSKEKRD